MERFIVILCTLFITLSASPHVSISMQATDEQQKSQVIDLTNIKPQVTSQTGGQTNAQQPSGQQNTALNVLDNINVPQDNLPAYNPTTPFGQKLKACAEACDDCLECFYHQTYGPSHLEAILLTPVGAAFYNLNMLDWGNVFFGIAFGMGAWAFWAKHRMQQLAAV